MQRREIFRFWLPLFASWLLMTAEGPLLSAAVNRLPGEVVMLAALGIVFSIAVTIESPVINLLTTATALVRDAASYRRVRKFSLQCMVLVTVTSFLVAATPLFDLVVHDWLETPEEIARWVRPGLQILIPWCAAIGWRRFLQGVLIRFGETRKIAAGTAVRLAATAGTALALTSIDDMPGIALATWAMMAGVVAEALYVSWVARPVVRRILGGETVHDRSGRPPLDARGLFWFHLPLAATSLLTLLAQPMVTSTLARLDRPELSLAAWPLVFQTMLVLRAGAFALPEVVIAWLDRPGSEPALRSFTRILALAGSVVLVLLAATPLADFYLVGLQDTVPEVAELARLGLLYFLPLPALATLIAWQRGRLIHQRRTREVNEGMVLQMISIAGLLALGLKMGWPGIPSAVLALDIAWTLQLVFLGWRLRQR